MEGQYQLRAVLAMQRAQFFLIKGFPPEDVAGGFQPQSQDTKQAEPDTFL